jgi:DNA modification methylase
MAPFSVLNTRTAEWQERRRAWLETGIKSEEGRNDSLTFAKDAQPPIFYDTKNALRETLGKEPTTDEVLAEMERLGLQAMATTSIFDPVLTELSYRWFNVEGGRILDPFAGGSVRGIVAAKLNMPYVGNDLSEGQVKANRENAKEVLTGLPTELAPRWTVGDSTHLEDVLKQNGVSGDFDLVFSCPPYADLEVYSNDPRDISNMDYPAFLEAYRAAIKQACDRLKPNRFAVFVVGDIRDKKGIYRNFVGHTIDAFTEAGLQYYNHLILVNQVTSLAIRVRRQFNAGRKIGKVHQNVLVFLKGSEHQTADAFEEIQVKKAIELFNKTRQASEIHDDVLVFYKGDPKAIKDKFGELHAEDNLLNEAE